MVKRIKKKRPRRRPLDPRRRCGLCGKSGKLTRTPCCGNWICDDQDHYVLFSYAHNSCFRNHNRYTVCGVHFAEGHDGDWQDCSVCREGYDKTEMYVWAATNEYNFSKLADPPTYEPTTCGKCGRVIKLGHETYSIRGDQYYCEGCSPLPFPSHG